VLRLLEGFGNLVEGRIVGEAEVSTKQIYQNPR